MEGGVNKWGGGAGVLTPLQTMILLDGKLCKNILIFVILENMIALNIYHNFILTKKKRIVDKIRYLIILKEKARCLFS